MICHPFTESLIASFWSSVLWATTTKCSLTLNNIILFNNHNKSQGRLRSSLSKHQTLYNHSNPLRMRRLNHLVVSLNFGKIMATLHNLHVYLKMLVHLSEKPIWPQDRENGLNPHLKFSIPQRTPHLREVLPELW